VSRAAGWSGRWGFWLEPQKKAPKACENSEKKLYGVGIDQYFAGPPGLAGRCRHGQGRIKVA
ncbi:MAG: hypothetical protein WCH37_11360, partial [Synechococcaceae cyanobacterium ELA182]